MKISTKKPTQSEVLEWASQSENLPFSYKAFDKVWFDDFPKNYSHDRNKILLGKGDTVFQRAKQAIINWEQFPSTWTKVYAATFQEKAVVTMVFRLFNIWWWNNCRIVRIINEPDKFGMIYGTLNNHVESGEELFLIEMNATGEVWYHIKAFSRPRFWMARIAKPFARMYQRRFVKESFQTLKQLTHEV